MTEYLVGRTLAFLEAECGAGRLATMSGRRRRSLGVPQGGWQRLLYRCKHGRIFPCRQSIGYYSTTPSFTQVCNVNQPVMTSSLIRTPDRPKGATDVGDDKGFF